MSLMSHLNSVPHEFRTMRKHAAEWPSHTAEWNSAQHVSCLFVYLCDSVADPNVLERCRAQGRVAWCDSLDPHVAHLSCLLGTE